MTDSILGESKDGHCPRTQGDKLLGTISHMVIHLSPSSDNMSSGSMDITESFRPEDISKTDFFDFVTTPDSIGIGINDRVTGDTNGVGLDAPLQGFDQVNACDSLLSFFFLLTLVFSHFSCSFGEPKKTRVVWNRQYSKI